MILASTTVLANESGVTLKLDAEMEDSLLVVAPVVTTDHAATLRYEVTARKLGSAGVTSTRQAGTVRVAPDHAVSLSTLRLSTASGDRYSITATLYDNGAKVAEKTLTQVR